MLFLRKLMQLDDRVCTSCAVNIAANNKYMAEAIA